MTTARRGALSLPCPCPDAASLPLRHGRWLFGGIGFHHFGHALIFSTARLWALDQIAPPDGLIFFDRSPGGTTRPGTTRNLTAILALLGIDLPVVSVGTDESVETLIVPDQGISTADDLFCGSPAYQRFLRARIDAVASDPPPLRDIYVSRSGLGLWKPGLMFEDVIEAHLAAAGYHVFHPQLHPLATQVATYRQARRIVGVDGSALHLVAFAARPGTRVAVLGRRPFYPGALADQARQIGGAEALVLTPTLTTYADACFARSSYPWFWSHALPDLPALGFQLAQAGFLDSRPDWPQPAPEALQDRLAYIERRNRSTLVVLPAG